MKSLLSSSIGGEQLSLSSKQCQHNDVITLSSSPIKGSLGIWIADSSLFLTDKTILEFGGWLTDSIIVAVQNLLKKQTEGKVVGFQSTQLSKTKELFKPIPLGVPFIQVLNIDENHWLTVSNVKSSTKHVYDNTVNIYDSYSPKSMLSLTAVKSICSFLRSPAKTLLFEYVDNTKTG